MSKATIIYWVFEIEQPIKGLYANQEYLECESFVFRFSAFISDIISFAGFSLYRKQRTV